jgi:NADH:ubiquinone oxidoreductase subunit E
METNEIPIATPDTEEELIDLAATEEIIKNLPDNSRGHLIPTLQKVQNVYRYLPSSAVQRVMTFLNVTRAEIYGVISFYPQLRITEPGKHIIKLCYGTACFVKGAPIIGDKIHDRYHIRPGETDASKLFTLQTASCLGNCGAAPMAIIGEDTHGNIDPEKTLDILGEYKHDEAEAPETEEATAQ